MGAMARRIRLVLRDAGWEFFRSGKGDHEIWRDPKTGRQVVLDDGIKSRHTANDILKDAGLPKQF